MTEEVDAAAEDVVADAEMDDEDCTLEESVEVEDGEDVEDDKGVDEEDTGFEDVEIAEEDTGIDEDETIELELAETGEAV